MEITVYVLFSFFCYMLFYMTYVCRLDMGGRDHVLIKLLMGIMFIALGLFSMKIEYNLPNGSPSSYTPIAMDIITHMWLRALFICYTLLGVMQMAYAGMDGLTLARKPKSDDLED
jgi:hypothetical protein